MKRPLAYITAAWSGNEYENAENAARYCRQVYEAGYSPICPILLTARFLQDAVPQEHKDGIDMARDYLRRSRVLVVCGRTVDETVKNDIATAQRLRITTSSSQSPLCSVSGFAENCARSLAPPLPTKSLILRGPQGDGILTVKGQGR